jgi:hypothetical protein
MADLVQCTDEIHAVIAEAWKANAETIANEPTCIVYTIADGDQQPTDRVTHLPWKSTWARVTVRDNDASSYGFGRRYTNFGTAYVNIFVPKKASAGTTAQNLAMMVRNAIRQHSGIVIFQRVRTQFVGPDGDWMAYNVLADFEFDETVRG